MNTSTTPCIRTGRAIHLVDIENLVGGPRATSDEFATAWAAYASLIKEGDAVVVGASPLAFKTAAFVLPTSVRWVVRGGRDGADLALMEEGLDLDHAARRYEWLVVGSGDRAFVGAVRGAKLRGMKVWSVSGRGITGTVAREADIRSLLRLPIHATVVAANHYELAA